MIRFNIFKKILGFVFISLMFYACEGVLKTENTDNVLFCDIETVSGSKDVLDYNLPIKSVELKILGNVSKDKAHSGKQSVLLNKEKSFGLSSSYRRTSDINYIKISVWRNDPSGKSRLIFQGNKESGVYEKEFKITEIGKDGWVKIEMEVYPPLNLRDYSIYVWRAGADSAYFDDLKIEYFHKKVYPEYTDENKMHLYFSDSKINGFEKNIIKAYNDRVHFSDGKWLKGIMSDENNVMPIKARLKGDWLDHFVGEKWSLRIKMREDYVFNRMRVFSIQSPATRSFLNEYVIHNVFNSQDVLTTRYGFIPVYRNRASIGVFAWEEHFSKQLIEYNLRREGPILKFDEDPFWRVNQHYNLESKWLELPFYETSRIVAFGMGKILEKPNLKAQFDIAQGLMYQYKNGLASTDEIFDIDALAKYWALIDVTNGRHGLAWHNQRMYYNPVICKLEPINFDNYSDHFNPDQKAVITALQIKNGFALEPQMVLYEQLFFSEKFLKKYYDYLVAFTNIEFLKSNLNNQDTEIQIYEEMISAEFPDYKFNSEFLFNNIQEIRSKLPELKQKMEQGYFNKFDYTLKEKVSDTQYLPKTIPSFINSYYYSEDSVTSQLLIENYGGQYIEAVGLADESGKLIHIFDSKMTLYPYTKQVDDTSFVTTFYPNVNQFVFKVRGESEIYYSELSPWEKKTALSPYQVLLKTFVLDSCSLFERQDNQLIVSGKHQMKDMILIPEGFDVIFEDGAEVDFVENAGFICHSPVFFKGTKQNPVIIYSSDSTANGFTVLQANGRSNVEYTIFKDLNTLNYNGWTLTGAVNFYESDVDINACSFESNHCEDALNIIRSDFLVANSNFDRILSDAFDSDFCTGKLQSTVFTNVLNDAIDFSTSQIEISDCKMNHIGDKGVSGGEGSTLVVINTEIDNCNIGAASKDLSEVQLENVNISNCKYGLVLLKKKPEYGPAKMMTTKLDLKHCEIKHLIEEESLLFLNNRKIKGTHKNVSQLFY